MKEQETDHLVNTRRKEKFTGWIDSLIGTLSSIPFWKVVVVVVLGIIADFIHRNAVQYMKTTDEVQCTRTVCAEEEDLLYGYYYISDIDDSDISGSAQMTRSDTGLKLVVYSDYEPVSYDLSLLSSGVLYCEPLGEGTVQYKPSFGTIRITFKKGGRELCELSK